VISARSGKVILWGTCLGGSIAAFLSTLHVPNQTTLLLENAFPNPHELAESLLIGYVNYNRHNQHTMIQFETHKYVKSSQSDIWIVHGTSDYFVPVNLAKRLYSIAQHRQSGQYSNRLFLIHGGHHGDLHKFDEYQKMICEI
jgi:fermentation-respiration switch protein FrsA (DUF1100 family)